MIGGGVVLVEDNTDADVSPVGDAEAVAITSVAAAAAATMTAQAAINYLSEDTSEAQKKADAQETKLSIWSQATTQGQNNENILTSFGNSLEDSKTIARMEGKNAYIRALNNGSTKTQAEVAAREAVEDYYTVRQKTLLSQWDTNVIESRHMAFVAENTSGISGSYLEITHSSDAVDAGGSVDWQVERNETFALLNGTNYTIQQVAYNVDGGNGGVDLRDRQQKTNNGGDISQSTLDTVYVPAPASEYEDANYWSLVEFQNKWESIKSKESTVQNNVQSFIDGTYDAYQEGEINNTDLVDPYLAARDYSPEQQFGSWALRSYASMGYSPPADLQNVGSMTIETENDTVSGVLLSDGLPQSGSFDVGTEYDTADLTGTQFVINGTSSSMYEITGNFTIVAANTTDGGSLDSVEYQNITYNSTSTDEYQQLMGQMDNLTAEINARQQELRSGGGIGLPSIPGLSGFGTVMILVLALLAAAVATDD